MGASNSKYVWDLMRRPTHDKCKAFLMSNFGSPEQIQQHVSNLDTLSVKIGESRLVQVLTKAVRACSGLSGGNLWDSLSLGITKDELYSLMVFIGLGWLFLYAYQVLDTQKDLMVMLFQVLTRLETTAILILLTASVNKLKKPFKNLFYALFTYVFGMSSNVLNVFKKIVAVVNKLMFTEPANANQCALCKVLRPQDVVSFDCGNEVHMVHPGCFNDKYIARPGKCPVCNKVLMISGDDAPDED